MLMLSRPGASGAITSKLRRSLAIGLGKHLSFALLLALTSAKASAATLGSLTTSVGLFAALATLMVTRPWSGAEARALVPASGALLVIGAAMLWRARRRPAGAPLGLRPGASALALRTCVAAVERPLPPGFDRNELLIGARTHFVQLQSAWDGGNMAALRALTTPEMLDDLCAQLPERGHGPNRTDVLTLQAVMLDFEDLGSAYLMSIEFSGLIRERADEGAAPFRELWLLAQSKHGAAPWRLARQQALL